MTVNENHYIIKSRVVVLLNVLLLKCKLMTCYDTCLNSNFRLVVNVVFFLLSDSPTFEFNVATH